MPKAPNYAKFFSVYLRQEVPENYLGEVQLDCVFPDCPNRTNHLYANCDTGEWHCKRCDEAGNARTLLTKLHGIYLEQTEDRQYKFLWKLRKIDPYWFEQAQWAYDFDADRWLVPYHTYSPEQKDFTGFLNNLGYFFPSSTNPKSQFVIHKAPTLPLYLYNPGIHTYPCPTGRANILEGEWDTLAWYEMNPDSDDLSLGKPGSGFPQTFLDTLVECEDVALLLDNDVSGRKQTASAILTLQKAKPKKRLFLLDWSLVPNQVKDIRDYRINHADTFIEDITQAIIPYDSTAQTDNEETHLTAGYVKDCTQFDPIGSFQEYMGATRELLYINPETEKAMAAVFSITTSIGLPGEPLWGFVRGPAASGKTTFIESFGGSNQYFDNLSKITAEAFVSGWKDESGEEASYLPSLTYPNPKTLFIKDFTTVLMSPTEVQQKIFGLLTDIYDGHVKIPYGNNQVKEFHNTYFNMIAGVTDILDSYSSASIGERFLRIDWLGKNYDSREYGRRALMNFGQTSNNKEQLTAYTLGFVNHLRSQEIDMNIDECFYDPILDLTEFIAIMRTKVESDRFEGLKYRPRPELIPRLCKQLGKLYVSAKVVYSGAADHAYNIVRKVAIDTCYGFPLDVVFFVLENPESSREDIAHGIDVHSMRAYRVINNLITTGVLKEIETKASRRNGRPRKYFELNPKLLPALQPEKYIYGEEKASPSRPVGERRRPPSARRNPRT